MSELKGKIFSDLGALCMPQCNISDVREIYKWNSVPYETADYTGTMLVAPKNARPNDVELKPELTGYHKIFVGLMMAGNNSVKMRLSGEEEWMEYSPNASGGLFGSHAIEDSFWRVADMTGQNIVIGKFKHGVPRDAMIAWVRFEPMTDAEVEAWKADMARTDTKRIYSTDDMHNRLGMNCPDTVKEWRTIVKNYEHSDMEWLSLEDIFFFDGKLSTGNPDNFAFYREFDDCYQRRFDRHYTKEMFVDAIEYGHKQGLKMCTSMRMGAWGIEFPYDQMYFANKFKDENMQFCCVDRDGSRIDALSYVYPEVRQYVIDRFVDMASLGGDAVEMMFHRGTPYVLYEEPVLEMFRAKYPDADVDPRTLPLDDPRINAIHCEIMTGFVRDLRKALDEARPEKRIGLHARIMYSVYDTKYVGVDIEQWVKEGLVTAIISYPMRHRERLEGDVWASTGILDLEKYAKYVRESKRLPIMHAGDFNTLDPMNDSWGVPQGPKDQKERVAELMKFEKEYGVPVYIEILPRQMPTLDYKARALELYEAGAEHISLWDTYNRSPVRLTWSMVRRLGHKDELPGYESGEGELYSIHRILKIGGQDISRYLPCWGG